MIKKNDRFHNFCTDMQKRPETVFSGDRLVKIAKNARVRGFIPILDLVYIMASEEQYAKALPILWAWELDRSSLPEKILSFQPNIELISSGNIDSLLGTKEGQATLWLCLFETWAGKEEEPAYLYFYRYNSSSCEFARVVRREICVDNENDCIKLIEFETFLERMGDIYRISLPLPSILYPKRISEKNGRLLQKDKPVNIPPDLPKRPLLRVSEVTQFFNVSKSTIYSWMSAGKLKFVTVGKSKRIPREAALQLRIDEDEQE